MFCICIINDCPKPIPFTIYRIPYITLLDLYRIPYIVRVSSSKAALYTSLNLKCYSR